MPQRVPAAFGLLALVALGIGALLRDRLQWYDAYAEVFVTGLHSGLALRDARTISEVGPYFASAMVIVAWFVARRRGAALGELARPLVTLGFALLCVEFLKLAVYRDRPFTLGSVQHDSFPSGDTAQVALCAAAALHLSALRRMAHDWLWPSIALVGSVTAIAIAFSRVYLDRHWVSDVTASLLIGLLFWGLAPRWVVSLRRLAVVITAVVVMVMAGPRFVLPSPMAFDDEHYLELPVGAVGLPPESPGERMPATWTFRTALARYPLVHFELVTPGDDAPSCLWLDLDLDRNRVASVPLAPRRDTYALPLPRLTPGLHRVRLQTRERCGHSLHPVPSFRVARVSIEGVTGHFIARF